MVIARTRRAMHGHGTGSIPAHTTPNEQRARTARGVWVVRNKVAQQGRYRSGGVTVT